MVYFLLIIHKNFCISLFIKLHIIESNLFYTHNSNVYLSTPSCRISEQDNSKLTRKKWYVSVCIYLNYNLIKVNILIASVTNFVKMYVKFYVVAADYDVSWSYIILWGMSSIYWFYVTGHYASFSGIQWNSAFLIRKNIGSNIFVPGVLVLLNTFISYVIHALFLPVS